jgi:diaminohydroxyphosphoribosylaminopyrimidine deaminase/5-amino-6-(5-phosphoribosylamino)uracil reductase
MQVTLKAAATLDGKIATAQGESRWITGAVAREAGHHLRHQHEAILVGIGTALADDPALDTRGVPGGRSPIRVVLDSRGQLPLQAQMLRNDGVPVWVFQGCHAPERAWPVRPLLKRFRAPSERPEVPWVLEQLERQGVNSVLVEGGASVHASFIRSGCVNTLKLFLAPKVIGGQGALSWCGDWGCAGLSESHQWQIESTEMLGEDLLVTVRFRGF